MFAFWHFSVLGSNHYGIAGYYPLQALKQNMMVSKCLLCLSSLELKVFDLLIEVIVLFS